MTELYHLNCLQIVSPINDNVCGHCMLVNEQDQLILIDAGVGLLDTRNPTERIGQELIDMVGYRFAENQTALRQIEQLGLDPKNVTHCIVSHLDNDHIGGLADFPNATIHVSVEELDNFHSGSARYLQVPMSHQPAIKAYAKGVVDWFGFEARKIISDIETEIFLVPLFGHTLGHCGVALNVQNKWFFYIGDAYYMRVELTDEHHPVHELARLRADDNNLRMATLDKIRTFIQNNPDIEVFCYHDIEEFNRFTVGAKAVATASK